MVVGSAVSSLMSLPSDDEYTGSVFDHRCFWIGVGGFTTGMTMVLVGDHLGYNVAKGEAIDAVNVYNSELLRSGD